MGESRESVLERLRAQLENEQREAWTPVPIPWLRDLLAVVEAAQELDREFRKWSEDANDEEYALWLQLRTALAALTSEQKPGQSR
jgi:hypothetical protein